MANMNSYSKLIFSKPEEIDEATALVEKRLDCGQGESLLLVGCGSAEGEAPGLTDQQLESSLETLGVICKRISAAYSVLLKKPMGSGSSAESKNLNTSVLCVAYVLVRRIISETDFVEVRIAVVGNVDAGKSTLLGVLTHCELDDGRGKARLRLFRHQHEAESGRTSSVGHEILGFDATGKIINRPDHGHLDWASICRYATKVVSFVDLAGHERYLKTTVSGLTGHAPDFCMVIIGANMGLVGMTKEHLGLALALEIPVFVVVTKVDMCPPNVLQETMKNLLRLLKSVACRRKMPLVVHTIDDVLIAATSFTSDRICPVFQVSSVNGENLDLLKAFLNLLSGRGNPTHVEDAATGSSSEVATGAEFVIDDTFVVKGVGTVVAGVTLRGTIRQNDTLLMGPDSSGRFIPASVRSVQRRRLPVGEVQAGQAASFALAKIKRSQIRKGMVLVSPDVKPVACYEFESDILVLHHPTTICPRYQAVVHVRSVRQTAMIMSMSSKHLRTGDHATVRFRFMRSPEYLRPGSKFVFREGRTKAIGTILQVIPPSNAVSALAGAARQSSASAASASAVRQSSASAASASAVRQSSASGAARHAQADDTKATETK